MNLSDIAKQVVKDARTYVDKRLDEFLKSLPAPEKGADGKSVSVEDVAPLIADEVKKAVAELPPAAAGADGRDGVDGTSVTMEEVKQLVEAAVSLIPAPKDGADGRDGVDGKDGPSLEAMKDFIVQLIPSPVAGPAGIDGKDADPEVIKQVVADAIAELPPAAAGADGRDGKDADPEVIKQMVFEAAAAMMTEAAEKMHKMVSEAVAAATAALDEAMRKTIVEVIEQRFADLPAAPAGKDGKDALQIEILPSIEEDKSYPRGTYALHEGGLWRSFEATKGMRGWEAVMVGIAEVGYEFDGARNFKMMVVKSDGSIDEKAFEVPTMIYRGIYEQGKEYQRGDTVTWAGSLHHCEEKTTQQPGTDAWTLVAKRGRDGKEGRSGKDGRDGRDLTKAVR